MVTARLTDRAVRAEAWVRGSVLPIPMVLAIVALVVLYLLATVGHHGLSHDELASILLADGEASLRDLIESRMRVDVHPPLYFLILHGWVLIFGDSVVAMRLLSLVPLALGALALWLVWSRRLVRLPLDLFALLMVTAYGLIQYADWARSYSLLVLWGLLLTLILVHVAQTSQAWTRGMPPRVAAALAVVAVLSALTHFFGLLFSGAVIATLALDRLLQRDWRSVGVLSAIGLAVLAIAGGWIAYTQHVIIRTENNFWTVNNAQSLWVVARGVGKLIFSNNAILVALIAWAVLASWRGLWRRRDVVMTVAAVGLAMLVAVLISVVRTPLTVPRYYVVFMPAIFFVSSLALRELLAPMRAALRVPAVLACFGISLALAIHYHLAPAEQWRESAAFVLSKCGDARSTVLTPPTDPDLPTLYTNGLQGFFYRYLLRGSSVTARGASPDALAETRADSCPVLLWAAHVDGEDVTRIMQDLGVSPSAVEIVPFTGAFVVLEK